MGRRPQAGEQGQSLIQFALMITMFFAFAALAVDVGNLYAERRKMQNAADAGALAAARQLCLGKSTSEASDSARDYMLLNGVLADHIGGQDISIQGNRVEVRARETVDTWLTSVTSATFQTANVQASAKAVCGAATSACGLWPVAIDYAMWEGAKCGESLVIWNAENDDTEAACTIGGVVKDICSCYDCDLDDNGSDDFAVMTKLARGWMDFESTTDPVYTDLCKASGCGASELACRIENSYGGRVTLPACIPGLKGVKAGVKDEVDNRTGDTVQLPLYSAINCASDSNCSGTEAKTYYVTKFGCATVDGWRQKFELQPKAGMPKSYTKIKSKAILVTKDCGGSCMTFCGSASDTPAEPWELRAASLSQ